MCALVHKNYFFWVIEKHGKLTKPPARQAEEFCTPTSNHGAWIKSELNEAIPLIPSGILVIPVSPQPNNVPSFFKAKNPKYS